MLRNQYLITSKPSLYRNTHTYTTGLNRKLDIQEAPNTKTHRKIKQPLIYPTSIWTFRIFSPHFTFLPPFILSCAPVFFCLSWRLHLWQQRMVKYGFVMILHRQRGHNSVLMRERPWEREGESKRRPNQLHCTASSHIRDVTLPATVKITPDKLLFDEILMI